MDSRSSRWLSRPAGRCLNWLRWFTMVVGVLALGAAAYFPAFAIPFWALVIGVRLLLIGHFPLASSSAGRLVTS